MSKVIILTGPTASGKSSLAVEFGRKYRNIDIINADSMQVYSELPILCANPLAEDYLAVGHKLYGFLLASEQMSAGKWIEMIDIEIRKTINEGRVPILVGGSSMYIRRLIDGIRAVPNVSKDVRDLVKNRFDNLGRDRFFDELVVRDPLVGDRLHKNDTQRILRACEVLEQTGNSFFSDFGRSKSILSDFDLVKVVLLPDVDAVYHACDSRFLDMVEDGVVDEVADFMSKSYSENLSATKATGCQEIMSFLRGEISLDFAIEKSQQSTRNYAKRQRTWFKNGFEDFNFLAKKSLDDFEKIVNL